MTRLLSRFVLALGFRPVPAPPPPAQLAFRLETAGRANLAMQAAAAALMLEVAAASAGKRGGA